MDEPRLVPPPGLPPEAGDDGQRRGEGAGGPERRRRYSSRCPMSLKGFECQVSKSVNSDTCPRPITGNDSVSGGGSKRVSLSNDMVKVTG